MEPNSNAASLAGPAEARALKSFVAVTLVMTMVFALFWQTTLSMVHTWARSDTYMHCFLVVPAVVWFVWQARTRLAATEARPWWPALIGLAGAGALWLVGELTSSLAPTQWAVVCMVSLAVLAMFGPGWMRVLGFPLAFLLFAVPFGEALTPALIEWTADFTVAALVATGIPVFREGQHFVIPSGRWSVVEACSGVRYLMASVVIGVLYAWTMYRSPIRRALFIGASVLVPILANWARAYLIVMTGHLSNNTLAVGVDHLIYGWVFFGLVIGAMFWIGARWREDHATEPDRGSALARTAGEKVLPSTSMLAAVVLVIIVWPIAGLGLSAHSDKRPVRSPTLVASGGWTEAVSAVSDWSPTLHGPVQTRVQSFERDGARVTVYVGLYRDQQQGSELVNSMNRLVTERGDWVLIGQGGATARFGEEPVAVRTASVRRGDERLRIWHWYWLDERVETSDTRAKISLALDRLLVRTDTSAWMAIFVNAETDAAGDRALSAFARDMGPALQAALAETAAR